MAALKIDNLWLSYLVITIAGLGIGGIVVPASIVSTIICPDELIATVAALTLSIRVLGGAIGYAIYYNVFVQRFVMGSKTILVGACNRNGINGTEEITTIIEYTSAGLLTAIRELPYVPNDQVWAELVRAGQETYAYAYPYVYYVSIAFGVVSIICSMFLGDIEKYMTDHIAVHMAHAPHAHMSGHHEHEHEQK
ncbi:MAG: hypothetical protein M1820_008559 [Bogoriella megaspora]|nr:MAG: hypothetical protein M1820_008559 [Bogoriella megaspora]